MKENSQVGWGAWGGVKSLHLMGGLGLDTQKTVFDTTTTCWAGGKELGEQHS